ncbi:MAG: hydantoinase/oxoprolinase family protein [Deltaproteobacteria bacterium]|jgi:N-methylhydantoinase A/oxoprolinase/acetone carboxylase beta subunit|nr:hydantoinase/oxoprolinase family protein [Deltaproteobacteria bacterium]
MPTYSFAPRRNKGPLVLGLDTGGTNNDAVLFDPEARTVVTSAKDFTTHHDLSVGIRGALSKMLDLISPETAARIKSVNLSTTLATNSIAEGVSHRVGLILVGFDERQDIVQDLVQQLPSCTPLFVRGGHDFYGREACPLDEGRLVEGILEMGADTRAWAVSSFFSVKNPVHEMRVAELVREHAGGEDRPVTLGQNLTGELGAVRRAATAALNAGLVLIIRRLLDAVKQSLRELGLNVPLMVVKGDSGVVSELWARERPIETVVSGPAAGCAGAALLAKGFLDPGERNLWVLDVGGTTSDLAYLENGRPRTNVNGAVVGSWTTMVQAVETTTRGLGGDSLVDFDDEKRIVLGPRRVLPLCRLAEAHPETVDLMSPGVHKVSTETLCRFFTPNLQPDSGMNHYEQEICDLLRTRNPVTFAEYQHQCLFRGHLFPGLKFLSHPSILVSAFTPTDALSVLGLFKEGMPEASMKAAYLLGMTVGMNPEEFSRAVMERFGEMMASMIAERAISLDGIPVEKRDMAPGGLVGSAVARRPKNSAVSLKLSLRAPVVVLGAPAGVLAPWAGKFLDATFLAPPRYEVASATGAAASSVSLSRRVDIVCLPDLRTFRAFLPDRLLDGSNLASVVAESQDIMTRHMSAMARLAGAGENCPVRMDRADRTVLTGTGAYLPMGTVLHFTAGADAAQEILPPAAESRAARYRP